MKCKKCGKEVPMGMDKCLYCGSTELIQEESDKTPMGQHTYAERPAPGNAGADARNAAVPAAGLDQKAYSLVQFVAAGFAAFALFWVVQICNEWNNAMSGWGFDFEDFWPILFVIDFPIHCLVCAWDFVSFLTGNRDKSSVRGAIISNLTVLIIVTILILILSGIFFNNNSFVVLEWVNIILSILGITAIIKVSKN